jgi:thioesterase domain-containing protein
MRPLCARSPDTIRAGRAPRLAEPPLLDSRAVQEELRRYEGGTRPIQAHVLVVRARSHLPEWATSTADLGWSRLASRISLQEVDADHIASVRDLHAIQIAQRIAGLILPLSSAAPSQC